MDPTKRPTFQLIVVLGFCLCGLHAAYAEMSQALFEAIGNKAATYPSANLPGTITAQCRGEMTPDRAVIVGGITAESIKPLQAKTQLENQLAEIQQYVASQGGRVLVQEKVRAIRQTPRSGQRRDIERELPFIVLQRLEFVFPRTMDIDEVLERLLQLGLDRYGKSIGPQYGHYGPKVVVYYRFSNTKSALDRLHRRCKTDAAKEWCRQAKQRADHEACQVSPARLDEYFPTQSLSLQSQAVLKEHGSAPIIINFPWRIEQLNAIELMGDITLQLAGTLMLAAPRDPTE